MQPNFTLANWKRQALFLGFFILSLFANNVLKAQATFPTTVPLGTFIQYYPSPSNVQSFAITGTGLTSGSNVTITPPANFEVSTDKITWYTNANPLVITVGASATTISNTPVFARLNASATGFYSGNIALTSTTSTGNTTNNLSVSGVTTISTGILEHWPMTVGNSDSAAERAPGVTASTPTLSNLYLSNGTQVPAFPAYSPVSGQAISGSSNGDGTWSNGSVSRTIYEQFTVSAASGYTLRADSISFIAAGYNTANTRFGISYSLDGFSTFTDVNYSTTNSGANSLPNQNTGYSSWTYALNGANGVTINAGQTLTIRIYLALGSTSVGRYALLKDVMVKGSETNTAATATIANSTLNPFAQVLGLPSATQTVAVNASNLINTLYVVAPTNYEISTDGATWVSSGMPLAFTPVSGSVNQTIYVRLNASAVGTYSGNIQEASTYTTIVVPITGTTAATPTIFAAGTLNNFSQSIGSPSATQTFNVSALNLSGPLTVTPPANYEVSADGGTTWFSNTTPLTINPSGTTLASTSVLIRLNSGTIGPNNGNIILSASGAGNVTVAVNGNTVAAPTLISTGTLIAFTQVIGSPSPVQTYTIAGSALTTDITVTPPAGYEVSDNGTNWYTASSPLVLTQTSGSVNTTTVSVRLNAATAGSYTGNILNVSTGATSVNIPVTGTALPTPVLTTTGTLTAFSQTVGTPSTVQTYKIAGSNLLGSVTITPPAGYEVSSNGTTWFGSASPLVLTPTNGTLASTTISVRLNATAAGNFNGNIANTTSGIGAVNLPVTGTVVLPPTITTSATSLTGFIQTLGSGSAGKKYTVSGANLTANVVVTPPAGYELSKDSLTWSTSAISLAPTNGTLAATNIFVRLNATSGGTYTGNITHTSTGATTKNVSLTGTAPAIVYGSSLATFVQQSTTAPSDVQFYTMGGTALNGNITITPPDKFQVSVDSGKTWSFAPQTIVPVNGTVNTKLYLRLYSGLTGTFSGNLVFSSPNAPAVYIPLIGITNPGSGPYAVYPVPAQRMIYISHPVGFLFAKVTIFNMAGQSMGTWTLGAGTLDSPIDISQFPGGIYIAHYDDGTHQTNLRFIKR